MEKKEFNIGQDFYTSSGEWRCTDIGTRTICAIQLNQEDASNYNGPPYSIPEYVFDENDLDGCSMDFTEFEEYPDDIEKVDRVFIKKGAYSRYKILLESKGKLQKWYDFENQGEQLALMEWCKENEIEIEVGVK